MNCQIYIIVFFSNCSLSRGFLPAVEDVYLTVVAVSVGVFFGTLFLGFVDYLGGEGG